MLNGDPLPWVNQINILQKGEKFIGKVNYLLQEFHFTSPPILTQVINTFATSFYGSSLLDIFSSEGECRNAGMYSTAGVQLE